MYIYIYKLCIYNKHIYIIADTTHMLLKYVLLQQKGYKNPKRKIERGVI